MWHLVVTLTFSTRDQPYTILPVYLLTNACYITYIKTFMCPHEY